ncbi:MAG: hypothetical protein K2Q10_02235 [Rhodospirillales bacterium]|nr:hypothetical protein [Rhodospirillales bacterium]
MNIRIVRVAAQLNGAKLASQLKLSAALALVSLFCANAVQAAPSCFSPSAAKAAQMRQLKEELNVAALMCSDHRDKYNVFVKKFGGDLEANAKLLRTHISDARSFDRLMTQMANQASIRAMNTPDYCNAVEPTFQKALAQTPESIESFAEQQVGNGDRAVCGTAKGAGKPAVKSASAAKPAAKAAAKPAADKVAKVAKADKKKPATTLPAATPAAAPAPAAKG